MKKYRYKCTKCNKTKYFSLSDIMQAESSKVNSEDLLCECENSTFKLDEEVKEFYPKPERIL